MARTASTMLELGTIAPDFNLPNPLTERSVSRSDFQDKPLLVVFSCNHCPFVLHILEQFVKFSDDYQARGLSVVMINSNDVENYVDDSPQKMVQLSQQYAFDFDYLYDQTQQVARAYQAACTPDFFLFDAQHRLVYRGQFDDARPGNDSAVDGRDLKEAVDRLLSGQQIQQQQKPSIGCNIKWKAGNEPEYF